MRTSNVPYFNFVIQISVFIYKSLFMFTIWFNKSAFLDCFNAITEWELRNSSLQLSANANNANNNNNNNNNKSPTGPNTLSSAKKKYDSTLFPGFTRFINLILNPKFTCILIYFIFAIFSSLFVVNGNNFEFNLLSKYWFQKNIDFGKQLFFINSNIQFNYILEYNLAIISILAEFLHNLIMFFSDLSIVVSVFTFRHLSRRFISLLMKGQGEDDEDEVEIERSSIYYHQSIIKELLDEYVILKKLIDKLNNAFGKILLGSIIETMPYYAGYIGNISVFYSEWFLKMNDFFFLVNYLAILFTAATVTQQV